MKNYLKAHEQSILNVGQYYMVAHVNVKNPESIPPIDIDVPIIPIWHNDKKDFNFPFSHYHIDGRFVSDKSKQAKIWYVSGGYSTGAITKVQGNTTSDIFYKKKKCIRLDTGVPGINFHAPKFIEKFVGKSCKGRKCPHWGTTMYESNGVLICPMHRLKGDIKKEVIISNKPNMIAEHFTY